MVSERPVRRQAVPMLLLTTLFWGLSFPLVKAIGLAHRQVRPGSGTWVITAYTIAPRFLLATAVLLAVLAPQHRRFPPRGNPPGPLLRVPPGGGHLLPKHGPPVSPARNPPLP